MDDRRTLPEGVRRVLDEWEKMIKLSGEDVEFEFEFMKCSCSSNVTDYEVSKSRKLALENLMEALTDPEIYMIGVCGNDDNHIAYLLQRVIRRGMRDNLFGVTVMVSIGNNPDLRRIQDEIAHEIGLSFQGQEKQDKTTACCVFPYSQFHSIKSKKAISENARQLSDKIQTEQKILCIFRDLRTRLDLAKLGIPFGVDHQGCKLILISESEEILSNRMNTQRIFKF